MCRRVACDSCGNVQISMGQRSVTHRECLAKAEGGFKMIKFVK